MYKILFIGSEELCSAFALTGIDTIATTSTEELYKEVSIAIKANVYGLIILDDTLTKDFTQKMNLHVFESNIPLVIAMPGEMIWQDQENISDDDYIAKLIKNAIGYQLNIKF